MGDTFKITFFSYSRIAKLEKLRQKGDFDSDEEDEGSGIGGRQAKPAQSVNPNPHPESAESSVEGIYLSGQVRQSHRSGQSIRSDRYHSRTTTLRPANDGQGVH